jgi:hypothetical protein
LGWIVSLPIPTALQSTARLQVPLQAGKVTNDVRRFRERAGLDQKQELLHNALDIAFPNRTQPGLPPALPFEKYAGTYHNAGDGTMTLKPEGSANTTTTRFVSEQLDLVWPVLATFKHVSAEHWLKRSSTWRTSTAASSRTFRGPGSLWGLGVRWRR